MLRLVRRELKLHALTKDGFHGDPQDLLDSLKSFLPKTSEKLTREDVPALVSSFWLELGASNLSRCHDIRNWLKENASRETKRIEPSFFALSNEAMRFSGAPFGAELERPQNPLQPRRKIPLRIAYILHNSHPQSTGGYASRAEGVARGLMAHGAEVTVITRPGYPQDTIASSSTKRATERIDGLTYLRLPEPRRTDKLEAAYLLEAIEPVEQALRETRPDIVLAASNYITARPAQIAARRLGLPFAYEVRGFWEITGASRTEGFADSRRFKYMQRAEFETASRSDLVFTLTKGMKKELENRGVPPSLIQLAPNSVDPVKFVAGPRDATLARQLNIPDSTPVIGYIGSFADYEGLDLLAEAAGMVARDGVDFRLLMVGSEDTSGSGLGPIANKVIQIAQSYDCDDRFILPGRVPFADVPSYYSLIDVIALPRYSETVTEIVSPIKPFEAMAMGKCVVVSNVGALAEIVQDGVTGMIFEQNNPTALKDALLPLLSDVSQRERLGSGAKKWVVQNRSWNETTSVMLRHLEDIAVNRRGANRSDEAD